MYRAVRCIVPYGVSCRAVDRTTIHYYSRISFLLNAHHLLQDVGIYLLVNSLNTTKLKKLCEIILQWLRKDNDM